MQLNLEIKAESDHLIVIPTKAAASDWPEGPKNKVIELIQNHFTVATHNNLPEASFPEITEFIFKLKEEGLFDFKFQKKDLHVLGHKTVMAGFSGKMKKILNKHTQTRRACQLSPMELVFVTQVMWSQLFPCCKY